MATIKGVNRTYVTSTPPSKVPAGEGYGIIRCIYDTYELTADTASADILEMGVVIPAGARVLEVVVGTDDLDGSGGTLDVGWAAGATGAEAADPDGFLANADVATAADMFLMTTNKAGPIDGVFKKFTEAVQPTITFDGDTDATSGTISLAIYFIVD